MGLLNSKSSVPKKVLRKVQPTLTYLKVPRSNLDCWTSDGHGLRELKLKTFVVHDTADLWDDSVKGWDYFQIEDLWRSVIKINSEAFELHFINTGLVEYTSM